MNHAEFESLPAAVAMWLERLYVTADGNKLPQGIEWTAAHGTPADVITLHTEHFADIERRRKQAAELDLYYGGKL